MDSETVNLSGSMRQSESDWLTSLRVVRFVCVPVQGSGTFAIEATLGTLVPQSGKVLVLLNGAYGQRMVKICEYYNRKCTVIETSEDQPLDPRRLDQTLEEDQLITHVAVVHCETTSGVLNPLEWAAEITARHERELLIDAMSEFGAIGLSVLKTPFTAVIASSNKCLQGVPGMGFCIVDKKKLKHCKGYAPSPSLDLCDQW